jgi:excisionase family DNA binding protein
MVMPELLTMVEVAKILQCSKAHVCNAVNGRLEGCTPIPVVRLGRRLLVRRETLDRWIAENESGTLVAVSPVRGAGKRA